MRPHTIVVPALALLSVLVARPAAAGFDAGSQLLDQYRRATATMRNIESAVISVEFQIEFEQHELERLEAELDAGADPKVIAQQLEQCRVNLKALDQDAQRLSAAAKSVVGQLERIASEAQRLGMFRLARQAKDAARQADVLVQRIAGDRRMIEGLFDTIDRLLEKTRRAAA